MSKIWNLSHIKNTRQSISKMWLFPLKIDKGYEWTVLGRRDTTCQMSYELLLSYIRNQERVKILTYGLVTVEAKIEKLNIFSWGYIMGWFLSPSPPFSYMEVIICHGTALEMGTLRRYVRLNEVITWAPNPIGLMSSERGRHQNAPSCSVSPTQKR